eukprot:2472179-Rhodomonas_salina.2
MAATSPAAWASQDATPLPYIASQSEQHHAKNITTVFGKLHGITADRGAHAAVWAHIFTTTTEIALTLSPEASETELSELAKIFMSNG